MKSEKGFRGVLTIDLLPKKIKSFENGIVNFDLSTGEGTHWVCYYNDPKYPFVEYFDPYGEYKWGNVQLKHEKIPRDMIRYLRTSKKKDLRYNSSFLQKPLSVNCGYFCMKYITERNKGKSPVQVLYAFTQQPSHFNESWVLSK